ncbi:MAG: hypothetical protein IPJ79_18460 [Bacteroidetes bacterium]|nr:hypothetical protein [Bacteroidota bacterium]
MRKPVLITSLLFFASIICCSAQFLDTLKRSFQTKPKLFFQLDSYNSIVTGARANAKGIKTGLDFNKKIRLGIGYFWLNPDVVEKRIINDDDTVRAQLKSSYLTLGAEYVLLNDNPWQVTVPVHFGFGKSYFIYPDTTTGKDERIYSNPIVLFEPAVTGHYKVIKWVGVGFGVGYRIMLKNNPEVRDNFNSPIYVLRIKIFFDEIYYSVFPKQRKNT